MKSKNLFTAKRVDNGEWITGDLIANSASPFTFIRADVWLKADDAIRGIDMKVLPSTVSQFTGKKLNKEHFIFENTIAFSEVENEDGTDTRQYVVCVWIEEWCMFAWLTGAEKLLYECGGIKNLEPIDYWTYPIEESEKYHYAGNAFDNSELLLS